MSLNNSNDKKTFLYFVIITMQEIYYKKDWMEFTYDMLKSAYENWDNVIFKYNSVYEIRSYKWKEKTEFWLHEIWQLKKKTWLPYTKRGRFCNMSYNSANNLLEREFFIV